MADTYEITKLEPYKFDNRLTERDLIDGRLDATEVDKHLAALPDLAEDAETFEVVLEEGQTPNTAP